METLLRATAVTRLEDGKMLLATTNKGLFLQEEGKWKLLWHGFNKKIRDLDSNGPLIYGVGDEGIFLRSLNGGIDWMVQRFPTRASIWNVCSNLQGLVVAHGEKMLYISMNFGDSWTTFNPFHFCSSSSPSIRSLYLHKDKLFIGTKIHPEYGGIWLLDLPSGKMQRVKKEKNHMTSAMTVSDDYFISASGSCRGKSGKIEFCSIDEIMQNDPLAWHHCHSETPVRSYLDLSAHEHVMYATSSQNERGISTVSRIFIKEGKMEVCGFIKGHGWRISNKQEDYLVAGLYESLHYKNH